MKRILIAEDNAPSRELVREILETEGYDVVEASDGRQALEMILASNPDLIVMNIQMPVLDGFKVVKRCASILALTRFPSWLLQHMSICYGVRRGEDTGSSAGWLPERGVLYSDEVASGCPGDQTGALVANSCSLQMSRRLRSFSAWSRCSIGLGASRTLHTADAVPALPNGKASVRQKVKPVLVLI